MKKILTALFLTALMATSVQADFLRVEAGAGVWQAAPSGDLTAAGQSANVTNSLGYRASQMPYVWAYIKHPIPLLPNLRLEYLDLSYDASVVKTINFNNQTFAGTVTTNSQIRQFDAAFYYNLLDNTFWATLDVGLNLKVFDASFDFSDSIGTTPYQESATVFLPMFYLRARAELPLTGLAVEADVKYISFEENRAFDARAKIDYTLEITPIFQPGIELGYRVQQYVIDDSSINTQADLSFEGFYGGIILRF